VYGWIGGDRPSDVLEQAKERKKQGFTAVKMNAVESVSELANGGQLLISQLAWLDSPHALEATVQRLAEVKSVGIDVGL
jgi:galactonate dehydratase